MKSDEKIMISRLFACAIGVTLLSGCFNSSDREYDKGYEAALADEAPPSYSSDDYEDGYEDGLAKLGYDDAYNYRRPIYLDEPSYMYGYKLGKEESSY